MITRGRSLEDRGIELNVGPGPEPEHETSSIGQLQRQHRSGQGSKCPANSFLQLIYPFPSSPSLRTQYLGGDSGHHVALWLEDMDTFAADVAGRHSEVWRGDRQQVTAMLEQLVWLHQPKDRDVVGDLLCSHNLHLSGQVSWVGNSSMQVSVELWGHSQAPKQQQQELQQQTPATTRGDLAIAVARFLLAARSLDLQRSWPVAPLQLTSALERQRSDLGRDSQLERKARMAKEKAAAQPGSASSTPHGPTPVDLDNLNNGLHQRHHHHQQQQQTACYGDDNRRRSAGGSVWPQESAPAKAAAAAAAASSPPLAEAVPMAATRLHHVTRTEAKDVNTTGTTFGGHLLRLGFEHALRVAKAHVGQGCALITMSDAAFINLVPIGAELHLEGCVAHVSQDGIIRVHVVAYCLPDKHLQQQPSTAGGKTTCESWFAFRCDPEVVAPVAVIPGTPAEHKLALHAQLQHNADVA